MQELGELWIMMCGLEKRCQKIRLSITRSNSTRAVCERQRRANTSHLLDKSLARIPKSGLTTSTSFG